ncbi:MAG: type II toxin-antitoxin system VapC family toxin [Gammaproteobacteria bacterium]|nr:type II toxin-antitoxin system VapC family toxin [Gammaproteobacteria bacterium]
MIILDTNIISELMKSSPSIKMIDWLNKQDATQLYITTITIAEISYGLNALPPSRKRQMLEDSFNHAIHDAFKHRIVQFTESAAHVYGKIMAGRKELGRPMSVLDGQIAAITLIHTAILATRNIKDFMECGLDLYNPFFNECSENI